ncbi:hypothetical protein ACWF82_27015 [Nocardia sp. NPDC055053]
MGEVLVAETASGVTPSITGTGNGGFVVVWSDSTLVNIKARILTADGQPATDEFQVNQTHGSVHPVAAMAAGGFVIAWMTKEPNPRLLLQQFSNDGSQIGQERLVSSTTVNADHRPVIARLPDRTVVVAWVSSRLDEGVRAAFFSPDLQLRGEVRVDEGHPVNTGPLAAASLQNNSFAIAWRGGDSDATIRTRLRIFAPNGHKPGTEKAPNIRNGGQMSMTFLDPLPGSESGHFVLAHTVPGEGEQETLVATVFNPAGDILRTFNVTHRDGNGVAGQPAAVATNGQGFRVAWSERFLPEIGDQTGNNIKVRIFGDEGALDTAADLAASTGDQTSPCIVKILVPDTGFRTGIAWLDDAGTLGANRRLMATTL